MPDLDSDQSPASNGCLHPSSRAYRWWALAWMCVLSFGSYFCYDNPAALQDNIEQDLHISNSQYGVLYSVYSWPNVILPFVGGFLVDRVWGIRLSGVLFSAAIMVGQIAFGMGAFVNSFALMVVGRVIFSLGGENLAVVQNNYAVKWFMGKELNTVFGIQLSFARFGSTINLYVMKPLYKAMGVLFNTSGYVQLGAALLIGGLSTVVSFASALILARMDTNNDRYKKRNEHLQSIPNEEAQPLLHPETAPASEPDVIRLKDVIHFPMSFWLLCAICVAYYVAIFPFVGFALVYFETKFGLSPYPWSEVCNSLLYFISIVACGPMGLLVDYFGRNTHWMVLAIILTLIGHGLLAFTFLTPFVATSIMGVSYSLLAASLWPCVAYILPQHQLGTAYGIMQSIQNLGMALFFWTAGLVLDWKGYFALECYFMLMLSVALTMSIVLMFHDWAVDGLLSKSTKARNPADSNETNIS